MKSIVCEEPQKFKMINSDHPKFQQRNAIINIKQIGICGTDLHAFMGNQPFFNYPRVLGHELAGTIDSITENPKGLMKGDQVSVIPYIECGECIACRNELTNCCTNMKVMGVHIDGGMCEQISVPYDHLIQTNELTLDQTAILEPLSIGAHALRRSNMKRGEYVLVIGAGPVGLGVMTAAKQKGAYVIAMDVNEERLDFARKWAKVDFVISTSKPSVEKLMNITNGDMPTIVFDATGNRKSMMEAFQYPANGGKLVFVGLVKSNITFDNPLFHSKEIDLLASRNATKEDFDFVKKSMKDGYIDANSFITHRIHFDDLINEFETLLKPDAGVIKAMVHF